MLLAALSKSDKRSHSRTGKGYSVSEDSESSASSNEGDLKAKRRKRSSPVGVLVKQGVAVLWRSTGASAKGK